MALICSFQQVIPVLPFALKERIGIPEDQVQRWTSILLAIYGASLFLGSPVAGWWADRTPTRKTPFLFGLVCLTISTVVFCFAKSLALMTVARIFQGLSAAVVWTVAMAIIIDSFESHELGVGLAGVTFARTTAMLGAPLLGGILYDKVGYYSVFYLAFGLLALDISLRLILIEPKEAQKWTTSVEELVSQQNDDQLWSETSPEDVEKTANRRAGLNPHARYQEAVPDIQNPSRQPSSIPSSETIKRRRLPTAFTLAKSPRMLVALWGSMVQMILFGAIDATVPLFVNRTFHWDSSGAGLIFLAIVLPTFSSPLVGWLSDKHGPRWYTVVGFLFTMVPLVLLRLVTQNTISHKVLFGFLIALIGWFAMFFEIPLWVEIALTVNETSDGTDDDGNNTSTENPGQVPYAQAFALANQMSAIGTVIGPIWGGLVYENASWGVMCWTLGLLFGVSAIPALIFTGGNIFKKRPRNRQKRKSKPQSEEPMADNLGQQHLEVK